MTDEKYTPPKVWEWDTESGGRFANINRPIAGATHDKELPQGDNPLQLYSLATPNGVKVTALLEELLEHHEGDSEAESLHAVREAAALATAAPDQRPGFGALVQLLHRRGRYRPHRLHRFQSGERDRV